MYGEAYISRRTVRLVVGRFTDILPLVRGLAISNERWEGVVSGRRGDGREESEERLHRVECRVDVL
jgi:hypothetical protein